MSEIDKPDYKSMQSGELLNAVGMDGQKWAEAFCQYFPEHDLGLMGTWFANACMAGYDEAQRRAKPEIEKLEVTSADFQQALIGLFFSLRDRTAILGNDIAIFSAYQKAKQILDNQWGSEPTSSQGFLDNSTCKESLQVQISDDISDNTLINNLEACGFLETDGTRLVMKRAAKRLEQLINENQSLRSQCQLKY